MRKKLSTWQTKKPTMKLEGRRRVKTMSDDERERLENSMLALNHDLNKLAWDMSCE
ncbi:MAG: hypothetical protein J6Y02_02570 [Pseudobutyrivibrio sp.]|nr:hypothetical protein [Pseudobutyrivibrio sp.]